MSSPNDLSLFPRMEYPPVHARPNTGLRHVNSAPLAEHAQRRCKTDATIVRARHCPRRYAMLINPMRDSLADAPCPAAESDMTNRWRVGCLVAGMLAAGVAPAVAQAPMQAPRTYECAANAHCSVY